MEPLMKPDEVANYLKIGKLSLYKLCKGGKIPFFRIGDSYRFNRTKIEEWIEKGGGKIDKVK